MMTIAADTQMCPAQAEPPAWVTPSHLGDTPTRCGFCVISPFAYEEDGGAERVGNLSKDTQSSGEEKLWVDTSLWRGRGGGEF